MTHNYYNVQEIADQYSQYGNVQLNEQSGVVRVMPFIEERTEVIVDSSVSDEVELEDIPPHLKQSYDLFFMSSEAIHPSKYMIRCVSEGKLESFNGKVWVPMPYRKEWAPWEEYLKEMETVTYPFVVLPHNNIKPRSFMLVPNDKMNLFKTLINEPNRQIELSEFEETWAHLFHPDALGKTEFPIGAWMHVADTPNACVDVVVPNGDGTVNVIFTVPPLMSLNQGKSSVILDDNPVSIEFLVKRCRSESDVIPGSGNERFTETFDGLRADPKELDTHYQMWRKIYKHYNWKFTDDTDNVNTNESVVGNKNDAVDDQSDPFEVGSFF